MICPKCSSDDIMNDTPNHVGFYSCECSECGFEFCYDDFRSEYFDVKGDKIKESA